MDLGFIPYQSINVIRTTSRDNQLKSSKNCKLNNQSFNSRRTKSTKIYACDTSKPSTPSSPSSPSSPSASSSTSPFSSSSDTENSYHESWDIYSKPGNLCVICLGKGSSKCLYCFGKGTVRIGPEAERDTIECPQCRGTAKEICRRCEGSGIRPNFRYVLNEAGDDFIKVPNLTNEEVNNLPAYYDSESYQKDLQRNKDMEEQRAKEKEEGESKNKSESEN